MAAADRPTILLTLRPEPGPVPEPIRLRRLLKALLRQYGLRCLSVEDVPSPTKPDAEPGATTHREETGT